ncbi:MAG: hypothetical protein ABH823_01600 [bacterium]
MRKISWLFIFLLVATIANYPNPFSPNSGQITTIECTPDTSSTAQLYIFDMSARLILRKAFNLTAGIVNRTTWNGYSDYNERVGNGVYPCWIIDSSNRQVGKGKIWVIN